jgi:hypothetical protein
MNRVPERWKVEFDLSATILAEVGIELKLYEDADMAIVP